MIFSDYRILTLYTKSFKDLSYDEDKKEYMTESLKEAQSYDNIVKDFYISINEGGNIPKSNDVLFYEISQNDFMFIEFKNGNINNKKSKRIIAKNKKSIIALQKITENLVTDDFIKNYGQYILVYNIENIGNNKNYKTASEVLHNNQINSSNSRGYIYNNIARKAANIQRPILFGLESIAKYYKFIATLEKSEFNNIIDDLTPYYSLRDNL